MPGKPPGDTAPKTPLVAAVAGTFAVQTLAAMAIHGIPVFAPAAAADYGVPETQIGIFTAVAYAIAMAVGLAAGGFVARYGAMRICQLAMISAAAGIAAFAVGEPWLAIVSALLIGIGFGPMNPASAHILVRAATPKSRPFVFSLKQTGVPVGAGFAGLAVPALIALYDWRIAALALAALPLLTALLVQPVRGALDGDRRPGAVLFGGGGMTAALRALTRDPTLRRLSLIAFSYAGAQSCFAVFLVVHLTVDVGMPLAQAGAIYAVSQAGAVAGRIVWGAISGRFIATRRIFAMQGLITGLCLCAVAAFAADWPLSVVLPVCLVLGTTAYGWNALYLSEVATAAPAGAISAITGAAQFIIFSTGVIFPPLFGGLAALTGNFAMSFLVMAGLTTAAGLYGFRLPREA
ncbi:MAG: MFS transporter [Alphaproteobacteria bacterium]